MAVFEPVIFQFKVGHESTNKLRPKRSLCFAENSPFYKFYKVCSSTKRVTLSVQANRILVLLLD